MTYQYQEYLAHHGIKGQRWGVIRTPEELGHTGNQVLQKWALYANSEDRSEKENTTPLVIEYRKKIDELQGKGSSLKDAVKQANKDRDWIGELAGAMLRDIGYKDSKEAREWMKKQPWMADLWTPYPG